MKSPILYEDVTTTQRQEFNRDSNNTDSDIENDVDNVENLTATATATSTENTITKRLSSAKVNMSNSKILLENQQHQSEIINHDNEDDQYGIKILDSMEYIIKFPTDRKQPMEHLQQQTDNDDKDDFDFIYKGTNIPIVMLLGWAGCQDRYLMKYSKIYEDRGLITMRYTAPVDTLFWKRSDMRPIGENVLKLIYDMNFSSHPVIFHVFSNGGAYLYQHISLAIRKYNIPLQIRGMVIDSAPGERRLLGLYRAISAIYGRERTKYHYLTAIVITLTLSVMWFTEEVYTSFKSLFVKTEPIQTNPFNDLKNEPNEFPQLFLYSKGDVIIPYTDVEKFIKLRQQQGVDVSSMCFEDAEHVKIYTKYPKQYIHSVCNFINNCLSRPYLPELYDNLTPTTSGAAASMINSLSSQSSVKYD